MNFDITTVIFLIIAVVLILRFRNELGRRTGDEHSRRNPYAPRENHPAGKNDNVVSLPRRADAPASQDAESGGDEVRTARSPGEVSIDRLSPKGSSLNDALRTIIVKDPEFDPREFLEGAKMAYEMIVTGYAQGDRKTLKSLLSRDVYEGFSSAIDERENRGEVMDFSFVGIDSAEIKQAEMAGSNAVIVVRFKSQIISATRSKDGHVLDGDPNAVVEVNDLWTFSRDTVSSDPNWMLIGTENEH